MRKNDLIALVKLRILVGYLGEQSQFSWWPSSFFTPSSQAFLGPVFGKTSFIAQCQGVKEAAARVHDEFIGVGRTYHLFRLPENIEQEIHQILYEDGVKETIQNLVQNKDTAWSCLAQNEDSEIAAVEGPVRIGGSGAFGGRRVWEKVAGHYRMAFENNRRTYPYFSEDA